MNLTVAGVKFGHAHNAVLQAAYVTGIPGAALYAVLLITVAVSSAASIAKSGGKAPAPFAVFFAFLSYFICGVFDEMFRSRLIIATLYLFTFALMLTPSAKAASD